MNTVLAFVVRTVGERTEELCLDLIGRDRGDGEAVSVIREPTHAGAIEKTLSTAAGQPGEWIVAVDADMLLYPRALPAMRAELESLHQDASVVHFAVADKLYRMKRWGVTVYRRNVVAECLALLREIGSGPNLKIERAVIKRLQDRGRTISFSRTDVALHDFFQYYADLYRKAYLNAVRNPAINARAQKPWRKMSARDADYAVILKGSRDGLEEKRPLTNSVLDFERSRLEEIVASLGLKEKEALDPQRFSNPLMDGVVREQVASLRRNKVARDFFEHGVARRLIRRAGRYSAMLRGSSMPGEGR